MINFQTSPDQYKHWKLSFDGAVARLSMDVAEDVTLAEGYKLKLNSYDLGVDIELADAIQRIRFEHPEVHAVARIQSQLLQIHERDSLRHRRRLATLRASLPRGAEWHGLRWRV